MNIDNLTIKEAREIAAMFGGGKNAQASPHIGEYCIIRTYASGVHAGILVDQQGRQVELQDARRIWRFDVKSHGLSLSEVANHGTTDSRSKVCEAVPAITILDALEIIPCSARATEVIRSAEVAKP